MKNNEPHVKKIVSKAYMNGKSYRSTSEIAQSNKDMMYSIPAGTRRLYNAALMSIQRHDVASSCCIGVNVTLYVRHDVEST